MCIYTFISCKQVIEILRLDQQCWCVQPTYPKHAEFYSKNKFEYVVHVVGFIIRIYHDAGHLNVKFALGTALCDVSDIL